MDHYFIIIISSDNYHDYDCMLVVFQETISVLIRLRLWTCYV